MRSFQHNDKFFFLPKIAHFISFMCKLITPNVILNLVLFTPMMLFLSLSFKSPFDRTVSKYISMANQLLYSIAISCSVNPMECFHQQKQQQQRFCLRFVLLVFDRLKWNFSNRISFLVNHVFRWSIAMSTYQFE